VPRLAEKMYRKPTWKKGENQMNYEVTRSGFRIALAVVALSGTATWAQGNPQFGMIGLAAGQTLRLNVVAFPPSPCDATIGFLNSDGVPPPNSISKVVTLSPGQAGLVDLTAASLGIQLGQRQEVQPVVTLMPVANMTSQCAASVEIFDTATGFSLVAWPPDPIIPNVSPQFGMVGIGLGQVLRLNVVAFPPSPCNATIGFLNSNGVAPPNSIPKVVTLSPGQASFVDLTAASQGIQFGQRMEFQPVVTVTSGPTSASACGVSAEVFDVITLRTTAILWPPDPI
jgi:hypothetical protein